MSRVPLSDSKKLQKRIDKILTDPFWPPNLKTNVTYMTTHDDNDGDPSSAFMCVTFSVDGDAWIQTYGRRDLRYRQPIFGGGRFPRIRNALLLLAEAIRLDGILPEREK
jgi:hypothetical protein